MKKLIIALFIIGLTTQVFAQDPKTEKLSEVIVVATNYKYLSSVDSQESAIPVNLLQRKAATYNIREADFYDDEYEYYTVSFFIPDGRIVAAYDKDGNIIRTIEKYKNIALPKSVASSVAKRFPKWKISKDVYLLKYNNKNGAKRTYKLILENGDERLRIKIDADGIFL
jgi:hypothetical protein